MTRARRAGTAVGGPVVLDHPLVAAATARLRAADTPNAEFRRTVRRLAAFLAIEATRGLPARRVRVRTPLESTSGYVLARPVVAVAILRAGLGLLDGVLDAIPDARVGHVGIYRDEETLRPVPYYAKLPRETRGATVLVVDPMLATGGSASHALDLVKTRRPATVSLLSLVAAPEGVRAVRRRHPDVPVFLCALDRGLDRNGYVRPGLGDAGDRIFGTEGVVGPPKA